MSEPTRTTDGNVQSSTRDVDVSVDHTDAVGKWKRHQLSEYELKILRTLAGEKVPGLQWGAAMAVTCEYLVRIGYARPFYDITESGKDFLKFIDAEGNH